MPHMERRCLFQRCSFQSGIFTHNFPVQILFSTTLSLTVYYIQYWRCYWKLTFRGVVFSYMQAGNANIWHPTRSCNSIIGSRTEEKPMWSMSSRWRQESCKSVQAAPSRFVLRIVNFRLSATSARMRSNTCDNLHAIPKQICCWKDGADCRIPKFDFPFSSWLISYFLQWALLIYFSIN